MSALQPLFQPFAWYRSNACSFVCLKIHAVNEYEGKTASHVSGTLQSACATAAGLNPKFMATKLEVLRLIGDREGVLEAELRRSMGNNPDTSKALR